jgi:ABC-type phosphate transport system substrate-binding protein
MTTRTLTENLRSGTSVLAISAVALIGASVLQPVFAQTTVHGLFGGGSTLASVSARDIFDCYAIKPATDPYAVPTGCSPLTTLEGLYAGVGSGSGLRGFVSNNPNQLFNGNGSYPANPPVYVDSNYPSNTPALNSYPYPRIDFGASDSPLPTNFTSGYTTTTYTVNWSGVSTASGTATYSTGSWGAPIQLPLFEANVAVAVNLPTSGTSGWTINSQNSVPTSAGGAIQLSTAQICAIFSGLVTDWNSAAAIPAINSSGNAITGELFDSSNTNATTAAGPYIPATSSAPINVVYRSDGSGTSYIFTNYLAAVCPQLDPTDAKGYVSIFSANSITTGTNYPTYTTLASSFPLPNTGFSNLISRIRAIKGATAVTNWVGTSGSDAVATNITSTVGNIGYLSNDFTAAYSGNSALPGSASVQNENLRINQVYHPGETGLLSGAQNFIAPTPANADAAWAGLTPPVTTSAFAQWSPYAQTYASGTQGGVNLTGLPILPLYNNTSKPAYPLSGTTFVFLYSCYGNGQDGTAGATRVTDLTNWLSWFIGGSQPTTLTAGTPSTSTRTAPKYDSNVGLVLTNSGFNTLPETWAVNIQSEYVTNSGLASVHPNAITAISSGANRGCTGVTGGAS